MICSSPMPVPNRGQAANDPVLRISDAELVRAMRRAELHEHELADPYGDDEDDDASVSWVV
ncbi:hypothetical protein [Niveibacterium sp.]|uniref:hypothetical protein n=1 Tax=Niveibacterium sp. TaxID=2017444 RepID=UPI0035B0F6C2